MAPRGLTHRVLLVGILILSLVALAGASVWATQRDVLDSRALRDHLDRGEQIETRLLASHLDEQTALRGYLITADPRFLDPYERAAAAIGPLTDQLRDVWATVDGPPHLVDDLADAHQVWLDNAEGLVQLVTAGGAAAGGSVAGTQRGQVLFDAIRDAEADIAQWITGAQGAVVTRLAQLQGRLTALVVATLVTLSVVIVAGCAVLWRSVGRPLERLAASTRVVAGGDLSAALPGTGAAEVRSLAADVGAMRDRLTAELNGIQRALEALAQSGPAVSALRVALEPVGGQVPGTAVAGRLDPAEGVLAGDWFDTVALPHDRLGLVVGDVAGHGSASAVFALRLKHSLLTALRAGLGPGDALATVCTDLVDVPAGQFATVFVAVIDPAEGTVRHANAGHPAGQLVGAGGWTELDTTGPLLSSVFAGRRWSTTTSQLDPGDMLLVHTDGVTEARDPDGNEFDTDGIRRAVLDSGTDDPHRVVDAVAAASMRFGDNRARRDDHTVVCVQRLAVVPWAGTEEDALLGRGAR